MNLASKHCIHPQWENLTKMTLEQAQKMLPLIPGWVLEEDESMLSKSFSFENFTEAMTFVNQVAEIAEYEQHHPDIHIFYNRINIDIWTHALQGLHENDFILASKINALI